MDERFRWRRSRSVRCNRRSVAIAPEGRRNQPAPPAAIVAVEDSRFLEDGGVDWRSVAGSAWENISSLRTRRGASTLSMQFIRLRSPSSRNLIAKFVQAVHASQLESRSNKRQILFDYLNEAPFGGNLVGVGAASWRYFGKALPSTQSCRGVLLAALPQNPNRLRPDRFPERALARRNYVLDRMYAIHDRRAGLSRSTE